MIAARIVRRAGYAVTAAGLSTTYLVFMSPWSQLLGRFVWRATTDDKVVALTFDDGPNEPFTSQILDFLDAHGAVGTFFMVGRNAERCPDVLRRIAHSHHELGNHSYRHQFRTYFARDRSFLHEIEPTQRLYDRLVGIQPRLFRPPWLYRTRRTLQSAEAEGLRTIGGEFCHVLEVFQPRGDRIARAALRKTRPGSIIIFHDGFNASQGVDRTQTVRAVGLVVSALAAQGWQMVSVSELLRRTEGRPVAVQPSTPGSARILPSSFQPSAWWRLAVRAP